MNKYEESFTTISLKVIPSSLFSLTSDIDIVQEACEKAQKYDELIAQINFISMATGIDIIKSLVASEIIEMIDAICADEKADVIWQSGAYIRNKYIAQKIKERYGIK